MEMPMGLVGAMRGPQWNKFPGFHRAIRSTLVAVPKARRESITSTAMHGTWSVDRPLPAVRSIKSDRILRTMERPSSNLPMEDPGWLEIVALTLETFSFLVIPDTEKSISRSMAMHTWLTVNKFKYPKFHPSLQLTYLHHRSSTPPTHTTYST